MKKLHKLIMTSSVYRQSSEVSKEATDRDAENVYLSHFNRRRLLPEEIRDTMLQSSGVAEPEDGRPPGGSRSRARRAVRPERQQHVAA